MFLTFDCHCGLIEEKKGRKKGGKRGERKGVWEGKGLKGLKEWKGRRGRRRAGEGNGSGRGMI